MAANLSAGYSDEDDGALSGINVTPLVDVTLVLLIVFMITVPAIVGSARVNVNVPETTAVPAESEPLPLVFVLKKGESGQPLLYLNETEINEAGVRKLFSSGAKPNEDQPVSLSADRDIDYGKVMKVIDLLESLSL